MDVIIEYHGSPAFTSALFAGIALLLFLHWARKTEESSAPNKICYLTLVMGEWRAPKKEWKREGGKGNNLDARHTRL